MFGRAKARGGTRLISVLVAIVLAIGLMPLPAYAGDVGGGSSDDLVVGSILGAQDAGVADAPASSGTRAATERTVDFIGHSAQLDHFKVYTYTDGVKGTENLLEGVEDSDDSNTTKYTATLADGDYWVEGYAEDDLCSGGIAITVGEGSSEFSLQRAYGFYASNSGWVLDEDYTISVQVTAADMTQRDFEVGTSDQYGNVRPSCICLYGDTVTVTYTPGEAREAEGFMAATKSNTLTLSSSSFSVSCPKGNVITFVVPDGSTVDVSTIASYYLYGWMEPASIDTSAEGTDTYTFKVPNNTYVFYRVKNDAGVTYWNYTRWSAPATVEVSADDLYIGSTEFTKNTVFDKFQVNVRDRADMYLTVNGKNFLSLDQGATRELNVFRNWQAINNDTANITALPDVHYTVIDENGNASDVVSVTPDAKNSSLATIKADKPGTAIVLVTYDAMTYAAGINPTNSSDKRFSANWPELTGVFVVAVGQGDSSIDTGMSMNRYTADTTAIDAEHDVLFYLGDEGADFTFRPESGTTVSVARSTVGANTLSFNGFTTDGVTANEDGTVIVSGLTTGRHIIKVEKDGKATYQVVTARGVSVEYQKADGTAMTADEIAAIKAGDTINLQFSGLINPCEKMAGIYNRHASILLFGEDDTKFESSPGGNFGVYDFSGNPVRQKLSVSIPKYWQGESYTLNGAINTAGFGSMPGQHRGTSYKTGQNAQYDAPSVGGILGAMPELKIDLAKTDFLTEHLAFVDSENQPVALDKITKVTLTDTAGNSFNMNADASFVAVANETYSYTVNAAGYRYKTGTVEVTEDNQTFNIELQDAVEGAWDGATKTEPQAVDDVYQISTGAELAWFAAEVQSKHTISAKLANDIDLAGYPWTSIGLSNSTWFDGTFDGDGHEVSGLFMDTTAQYAGLFGYVTEGAVIKNVTVSGSINAKANYAAGVAAYPYGTSSNPVTIENAISKVNITAEGARNYIAGIAGYANNAVITNCANLGQISGNNYVAGIAGYANSNLKVTGCYNAGNITANQYAAGIMGYNYNPVQIADCYNAGDISSASTGNGGIVGQLRGASKVTDVYNVGTVTGGDNTQSLFGVAEDAATIDRAYSLEGTVDDYGVQLSDEAMKSADLDNAYFKGTCDGYAALLWQEDVRFHTMDESSATVVPPDCTHGGYTLYVCPNCNAEFVDNRVDALGHTADADKTVDHGWCSECVCATCGESYIVWSDGRLANMTTPIWAVSSFSFDDNDYAWDWNAKANRFESTNVGVNSSTSETTINFTTTVGCSVKFDYGVSSESGWDKLTIAVASGEDVTTIADGISGDNEGIFSEVLPAGTYSATFSFNKDSSSASGTDRGWFSSIAIEPQLVVDATVPDAMAGTEYEGAISYVGAAPESDVTFYSVGGFDVPGLVLLSDGSISGTPTAAGTYTFKVLATDGERYSKTTEVTLVVNDDPAITTESLPGALAGEEYEAAVEAVGYSENYTFSLAEGSELPEGITLSEDGTISGTAPEAPGKTTFVVVATAPSGKTAEKELSIMVKTKYRQATGTVYLTVSDAGEWVVSDGEISGTKMCRVPIDLAELSKLDLDDYGYGQYKYTARKADGSGFPAAEDEVDYVYEVTLFHVWIYAHLHYYSGGVPGLSISGGPGSTFMSGFFGHDSNLNYYYNAVYPIDWEMTEQWSAGYNVGATADHVPLYDGDFADVSMFSMPDDDWKYGADFRYFTPADDDTVVISSYGVQAPGESFQVRTATPVSNMWNPSASMSYRAVSGVTVEWGTEIGEPMGCAITDGEGLADVTIYAPGDYYIWGKQVTSDMMTQALPAFATVKVEGEASPVKPIFITDKLPGANLGEEYSATVKATGYPSEMTYSAEAGTLPEGLSLSEDGTITGTPTEAGKFEVTVLAINDSGGTTATFELNVYGPIEFVTQQEDIPQVVVGQVYDDFQFEVTGVPADEVGWASGAGLGYVMFRDGVLSSQGRTVPESYAGRTMTLNARAGYKQHHVEKEDGEVYEWDDYDLYVASKQYQIYFVGKPAITTESIPDTVSSTDYSFQLEGSGGGLSWEIIEGSLPSGITLDAKTGVISGRTGTSTSSPQTLTVRASNAAGSVEKTFTYYWRGSAYITTEELADAGEGVAYEQQLEGGISSYYTERYPDASIVWDISAGTLPEGLAFDADTQIISGTPAEGTAGDYSITTRIRLMDGTRARATGTKSFTLHVDAPLSVTTESLPNGIVGEAYEYQLEAAGYGAEGATWAKASGTASYVSVSETGLVTIPARTYWSNGTKINVKVTNAAGQSADKQFTIKILNKYKQFTGASKDDTIYISVSQDGKFVTSDGEDSGTLLSYVPVKLADVAKVDLDAYGLADYKLASDGTGNYAYEVTYLQAMLYAHDQFFSGKAADGFATGEWSAPGSLWVSKFWGVDGAYFTYGLNGQILIDEAGNMPTADTVALKADDDLAMNCYADSSWYGDSNTADYYFVDGDAVQHNAEAFAGVEASFDLVKVFSSVMDPEAWTMQSNREPAKSIPVAYGKAYDAPEGAAELATDENGNVKITFPEAGTWYVWANGIAGAEHPDNIVSAPAMVAVTVTDQVAPTITTESLPGAALSTAYSAQLEAEGNPAEFTWTVAEGSALPEGLVLSEDGVISGTSAAVGTVAFSVVCSNGVDPAATKEFSIQTKAKYPELEGTVYITISEDGEFAVSDGEDSGTTMWAVPVKLADLASVDLAEFGLEKFYLPAADDADYAYEITALQLMAYAVKHYSADQVISVTRSSTPRHVFFDKFFGYNSSDFMYNYNGEYPWDETLGEGEGATADAIVLADGDSFNIWHFTNSYASMWYSNGVHEFRSADGGVAREYTGNVDEPIKIHVTRTGIDYQTFQPGTTVDESGIITNPRKPATPYTAYYGRAYGDQAGSVELDEHGEAELNIPESGKWFVWVEGSYVSSMDFYESSPAMAKLIVSGSPVIKTVELPDATVFTDYSASIATYDEGEGAAKFIVDDESQVPEGLAVAEDGTVSGQATTPGDYEFIVYAVNEAGVSEPATIKMTVVGEAPALTTAELAEGAVGAEYSATIEATGNPAPAITVEGLPEGLSFNAETGVIEGTPTQGGEFDVAIKASNGLAPDAEATLKLGVKFDPAIVTEALPEGFVGADYEAQIEATGYPQPTLRVTGLPEGLSFDKETGKISGVPTAEGTSEVTIIAVGGTQSIQATLSIKVTAVDEAPFNAAKAEAEQKIQAAESALDEAKIAAAAAQAAAEAVDAATDPAAKAEAAAVAADAAKTAAEKADAAVEAANQAVEAAQVAEGLAVTNDQKDAASALALQADGVKAQADAAKEAADAAAFDAAKQVAQQKVDAAEAAIAEAEIAADAAKKAAAAVDAATDPAAKVAAAQAAVEAAQIAADKAAAAATAAEEAVAAVQAATDAAKTEAQATEAAALVETANADKTKADETNATAGDAKKKAEEAKAKADAAKADADKKAQASKVEAGKTYQVGGMSYQVTKVASGNAEGTVSLTKAKDAASVTVPATVKLADGKTYKVDTIKTKTFNNLKKLKKATIGANIKKIEKSAFFKTPKLKKLVVKSKLLKKKSSVKGALKGSKAKKLKVKVPKKLKKQYKKSFKKKNLKAPKKVTVK